MKNKNLIVAILLIVLAGAGGFFGGMQYQKSKKVSFGPGQFPNGANRQNGTQGNNSGTTRGFRPVSGEIVAIGNNTITVKTQDGSSKIIIYSDSTKVNKTSEGLKEDLKTGEQIMVIGTEGTDGTVTAQNISIGGGMFQGASAGGQPGQGGQPPAE